MVPQMQDLSKGWPLILGGIILLFYALGILNWRLVIFVVALYLILLGTQQIGGIGKIKDIFKK